MERFKVEHLLLVAFSRVQAKPSTDGRLFSVPSASPRADHGVFVPPTIKPAGVKGDFSAGGRRDSQTSASQRSFLARLLFGDLDVGTYRPANPPSP